MKRTVLIIGCFLSAIMAVPAPRQTQAEKQSGNQPTAAAAARGVLLDVVVTDKRNRLTPGLKEEDFAVFEDNAPQKILSFVSRAGATQPPKGAPPSVPATSKPTQLIFLLDFSTTEPENQKRVSEAAIRFVEKSLGPDDYVAIFYLGTEFGLLQEFTNDKALLTAVLNRRDAGGISRTKSTGSPSAIGASAAADSIQAINQALAATGAAAGNAAAMTDVSTARVGAGVGSMGSAINQRTTSVVLTALEGISRAVAPLEGRKTLVLFSQGFSPGPQQEPEMRRAIDTVNKSNVSIYTVEASGLKGPGEGLNRLDNYSAQSGAGRVGAVTGESIFDKARSSSDDSRDSALRYLAESTGGIPFRNMNDLTISLDRVLQDMKSYYTLIYQPTNQALDGKFRSIRVEVKKSGLTARTRSGYIAALVAAKPEPLSEEESQLMAAARSGATPLPFDVSLAQFQAGDQRFRVPVTFEIPGRDLQFGQTGDKRSASLLLVGLVRDKDGNIVMRVGTPVTVSATEEEYKVLANGSVSFTNTIELAAGQYSFEAFVRDQGSARGSVRDYSLNLTLPGDKLASSSIVLGSQADPLRPEEQEAELVLGKARLIPSAGRRFKNGENLIYLFNVYNFSTGAEKKPNLEVRPVIEKPGSAPVKLPTYSVDQMDAEPVVHATVGRFVSIKGLTPGRYFFVAEVEDLNTKQICRARTSFEIVP